jgi:hypothetical protein
MARATAENRYVHTNSLHIAHELLVKYPDITRQITAAMSLD